MNLFVYVDFVDVFNISSILKNAEKRVVQKGFENFLLIKIQRTRHYIITLQYYMTYPEWAKLDQYVSTLWDTRAFAGDDLKSKDDISGAKGRPKTNGRIPPLGSVSESCKAQPGIEFKYLIFGKHVNTWSGNSYTFSFSDQSSQKLTHQHFVDVEICGVAGLVAPGGGVQGGTHEQFVRESLTHPAPDPDNNVT